MLAGHKFNQDRVFPQCSLHPQVYDAQVLHPAGTLSELHRPARPGIDAELELGLQAESTIRCVTAAISETALAAATNSASALL